MSTVFGEAIAKAKHIFQLRVYTDLKSYSHATIYDVHQQRNMTVSEAKWCLCQILEVDLL